MLVYQRVPAICFSEQTLQNFMVQAMFSFIDVQATAIPGGRPGTSRGTQFARISTWLWIKSCPKLAKCLAMVINFVVQWLENPSENSGHQWMCWKIHKLHLITCKLVVSTPLKNMKVRLDHHPNYWGK